jgi:hypothetical protein
VRGSSACLLLKLVSSFDPEDGNYVSPKRWGLSKVHNPEDRTLHNPKIILILLLQLPTGEAVQCSYS